MIDLATNLITGPVIPLAGNPSAIAITSTPPPPPEPPTVTATIPASPANDNSPEVRGSAEPGSTVNLYTTPECSGAPAATGAAAAFIEGLTVTVADDSTTTFRATATDAADNTSGCSSSSITYTEDSTAPNATIDSGPFGTTDNPSPAFAFSANEPASFQCRVYEQSQTPPDFAACSGPGNAHTPAAPLADGDYSFETRATDTAGNTGSAASRSFTVDTSAPVEPPLEPVNGRTAVTEPVSGVVKIKKPGGGFVRLKDDDVIPTDSLVDATKGVVRLITETGNGKSTQSAIFYAGIFKFQQPKGKTLVTLTLAGGKKNVCKPKRGKGRASVATTGLRATTVAAAVSARKRSRKVVRRLWGKGKGRYRSKGKRGAVTVRGTQWLTADRCDGTFFRVKQGVVTVNDFGKKGKKTLRRGGRYLARAR